MKAGAVLASVTGLLRASWRIRLGSAVSSCLKCCSPRLLGDEPMMAIRWIPSEAFATPSREGTDALSHHFALQIQCDESVTAVPFVSGVRPLCIPTRVDTVQMTRPTMWRWFISLASCLSGVGSTCLALLSLLLSRPQGIPYLRGENRTTA